MQNFGTNEAQKCKNEKVEVFFFASREKGVVSANCGMFSISLLHATKMHTFLLWIEKPIVLNATTNTNWRMAINKNSIKPLISI